MGTKSTAWSMMILAGGILVLALVVLGWSWKSTAAAPASQVSESPFGSQTSQGGRVTINVDFNRPKEDSDVLTFEVGMDTHSVNLDAYDLSALSVLRNDRGQEILPVSWGGPEGGHHRSGVLTFPASDEAGEPFLTPEVHTVELVIRDVAGVPERVLTWEVW